MGSCAQPSMANWMEIFQVIWGSAPHVNSVWTSWNRNTFALQAGWRFWLRGRNPSRPRVLHGAGLQIDI